MLFLMSPVTAVELLAEAILFRVIKEIRIPACVLINAHLERVGLKFLQMDSIHGYRTVRVQKRKGSLGFSIKGGSEHGIPVVVSEIERIGRSGNTTEQF